MPILENINKFKNANALITEKNEIIDYKTLVKLSDRISKKVKSRQLVFLVCGNNVESIVGYISFLKTNCVIALLDEKQNLNQGLFQWLRLVFPAFLGPLDRLRPCGKSTRS